MINDKDKCEMQATAFKEAFEELEVATSLFMEDPAEVAEMLRALENIHDRCWRRRNCLADLPASCGTAGDTA